MTAMLPLSNFVDPRLSARPDRRADVTDVEMPAPARIAGRDEQPRGDRGERSERSAMRTRAPFKALLERHLDRAGRDTEPRETDASQTEGRAVEATGDASDDPTTDRAVAATNAVDQAADAASVAVRTASNEPVRLGTLLDLLLADVTASAPHEGASGSNTSSPEAIAGPTTATGAAASAPPEASTATAHEAGASAVAAAPDLVDLAGTTSPAETESATHLAIDLTATAETLAAGAAAAADTDRPTGQGSSDPEPASPTEIDTTGDHARVAASGATAGEPDTTAAPATIESRLPNASGMPAVPTTATTTPEASRGSDDTDAAGVSAPMPGSRADAVAARPSAALDAPAPTPRHVAEPPHTQVVRAITPLLTRPDGSYSLQLQLRPAELGLVEVQVEMRNGQVDVTLRAQEAPAVVAINEAIDDLRTALRTQGVEPGALSVGHHGTDTSAGSNAEAHRQTLLARQGGAPVPADDAAPVSTPAVARTVASGTSALDVRM